jgi:tRNA(fMet)-specific endonuclease VapC
VTDVIDYLLDTNVVSSALRGRAPGVVRRMKALKRERIGLSVITAMELRFGVARNPTPRLAHVVDQFLRTMTVMALEPAVAESYAKVRAHLERSGRRIGALDTIIAAHALAIDAVLVTNGGEFSRVPGLRVEDWT